ncbi:MAG: hypothetical protein P9M05_11055 [Candidatus Stygibacter australis]|nr:hypothetical protein [Candidatus Stygibacter australis]
MSTGSIKNISILLCLLLVSIIPVYSDVRLISEPDWQIVNYCNSTTAYGRITLDGADVSTEERVGAFVDGECRGWQYVSILDGQSYVTLVINGEFTEEVEFYLYQATERLICPISYSTMTSPGNVIGYPPDFLPLTATTTNSNHLPYLEIPDVIILNERETFNYYFGTDFYDLDDDIIYFSSVLPNEVEISLAVPEWQAVTSSGVTTLFAEMTINDEAADEGDLVSAFVGNECRAVAEVEMWDSIPVITLIIFGTSIESVIFKIHDISEDRTWLCDQIVNTQPGGMIGYPDLLSISGVDEIIESDMTIDIAEQLEQNELMSIILSDYPVVSQIRQNILLDVGSGNLPPVLSLPEVLFYEDDEYQLDLQYYTTDLENDEINYQIVNNSVLIAQICSNILNISAPENWFGDAEMLIYASDGGRLYDLDTLIVHVLPVNDAPVLVAPENITFSEDNSGFLDLSNSYDVDNDDFEININDQGLLEIFPQTPQWQPVIYNNTASAYLQVTHFGESVSQGTIIAAFSDSECRGTITTTNYQGNSFAILPIYCQGNDNISFKAYDPEEQMLYLSSISVIVTPNSNIGFPPDYYLLNFDNDQIPLIYELTASPDWNGNTILEISINDSIITGNTVEIEIIVAPEPDEPCINLPEQLIFAAELDDWIDLNPFIYEPDGEQYELFIDDNDGLNLNAENGIMQITDAPQIAGDYHPLLRVVDVTGLSASVEAEILIKPQYPESYNLLPGWNWFSLPIGTNHPQPDNMLSSIGDSADYLKGQTGFINFYPGLGWNGPLLNLTCSSLYKAHLLEPAVLHPEGWIIEPEETEIEIYAGWNWISYIPAETMSIDEALADLSGNLDYIKYQSGYALYYEGIGWVGPLEFLDPGEGYMVHALYDQVFNYPQATRNNIAAVYEKPKIKIDYSQYEYTASITAIISGYTPHPGDELIAYAGDRIAGYASFENQSIIDLNEQLGEYYYFIYLYTNELEPADLKLELINTKNNITKRILGNYSWQPDSQQGNLENPVLFHFEEDQEISDDADIVRKVVVYPNPLRTGSYREQVKINLPIMRNNPNLEAGLYNLRGQKISNLELENKNDYWLIKEKNNWNYPNGIYLVSIRSDEFRFQGKLLLIK